MVIMVVAGEMFSLEFDMVSREERLGFQRVLRVLAKIVNIDRCPNFLEFIKGI